MSGNWAMTSRTFSFICVFLRPDLKKLWVLLFFLSLLLFFHFRHFVEQQPDEESGGEEKSCGREAAVL